MKKFLLLFSVLVLSSLAAHAQGAIKYPVSDPTGTACGGYDFALYQGKLFACTAGLFVVMPVTPSGNANFVLYPSASPNGNACSASNNIDPLAQVFSGTVYTCQAGFYTAVAGGGGGGGNVSNSGTPTAGQLGVWVTATTIKGVTATQDCSVSSTGVFTCTKTNNLSFGPLATQAGGSASAAIIAGLTFTPENAANKNAASGYAGLDAGTKLLAAQLPNPSASTLGGVQSLAATTHQFLTSLSTLGVLTAAQPDYSDLTNPPQLAQTLANASHKWFNSYSATTGLFTQTQPDLADFTGIASAAQGGTGVNSPTAHAFLVAEGSSPASLPTPPTANGQYFARYNVTGNTAVDPDLALAGVGTNAQTGTTYTILYSDRLSFLTFSNAGSIAVTLPQSNTTGFTSNFSFVSCDIGVGTATITPTVSTISYSTGTAYTSGASSLALSTGQCAFVYSDNANYFAIVRNGSATGFSPAAGKTLTVSNSLTLAGTDGTTMTFPSASATVTQTIGSGTVTVTGDAPTSGACASEHTVSITGLLTSDVVHAGFNSDPTAVTGIAPVTTGGVYVVAYPKSAGTLGLKVCNDTASTITVGTLVLNYSVTR